MPIIPYRGVVCLFMGSLSLDWYHFYFLMVLKGTKLIVMSLLNLVPEYYTELILSRHENGFSYFQWEAIRFINHFQPVRSEPRVQTHASTCVSSLQAVSLSHLVPEPISAYSHRTLTMLQSLELSSILLRTGWWHHRVNLVTKAY